MALGMEVGLSPGDFVFDGEPATPEQRAHRPPSSFGPCLLWQTAGWMKTPLAWYTEVDLDPGHIVLDGGSNCARNGHMQQPRILSARVYCGRGRPSQLLLSSCMIRIYHLTS